MRVALGVGRVLEQLAPAGDDGVAGEGLGTGRRRAPRGAPGRVGEQLGQSPVEIDLAERTGQQGVDGVALDDVTVIDMGEGCGGNGTGGHWYSPLYDTIRLGWEHYQMSDVAHDLWIDDVAIDTDRIGCPAL